MNNDPNIYFFLFSFGRKNLPSTTAEDEALTETNEDAILRKNISDSKL
jgi:hypothetical protein